MKQTPSIPGLQIIKKLAEGGQGEVFLVQKNGKEYALKLYHQEKSAPAQRKIITQLVDSGIPAKECSDKFIWPLEMVNLSKEKRFGYLMELIDTTRFITLSDIEAGRIPHPGFGVMAEAGRQLAKCFRELHIAGYCYRDISKNNFMLCPKTGNIVICDNDNIVIDRQKMGNIIGTPEFVAPEVLLGTARPSTVTDLHSLATLLFVLLCGGHPLHGKQESRIKILDGVAAQQIYGHNPVFVFDPKNKSNRLPNEAGYRHVASNWKILPSNIKTLFARAFTDGLKEPATRVTDIEWRNALTQMLGQRHICQCGAENFWDPYHNGQQKCWHRQCDVAFPPKLYIKGKSTTAILIKDGQMITSMHLGEKSSSTIIGKMEKHPSDDSLVLLRNKTVETWNASLGKQIVEIPDGRAIPLHLGISIKISSHELTVHP